jgi:hypothetical protein
LAFPLIQVMEGERSPTLEEVVGGEREVSWPEAMAICSSSGDTFEWQSGDGTDAQSKESRVVVLRKSARSYDFGVSTITVGRIW